jgi:hypothetical protein
MITWLANIGILWDGEKNIISEGEEGGNGVFRSKYGHLGRQPAS